MGNPDETSAEIYSACRSIAEGRARRAGAPAISKADVEEVWIRAGSRIDDEIGEEAMRMSQVNLSQMIDLEEGGSFEFLVQRLMKLYSEIPDDKKSDATYTVSNGWSGQTITVKVE